MPANTSASLRDGEHGQEYIRRPDDRSADPSATYGHQTRRHAPPPKQAVGVHYSVTHRKNRAQASSLTISARQKSTNKKLRRIEEKATSVMYTKDMAQTAKNNTARVAGGKAHSCRSVVVSPRAKQSGKDPKNAAIAYGTFADYLPSAVVGSSPQGAILSGRGLKLRGSSSSPSPPAPDTELPFPAPPLSEEDARRSSLSVWYLSFLELSRR